MIDFISIRLMDFFKKVLHKHRKAGSIDLRISVQAR